MANGSRDHLWQVDILRLLTFFAVICVHSLAFTQVPSNQVAAGLMMLLQFGREVFFAITGFVLVYSTLGRSVAPLPFWRKRYPYVVLPYLTWTAIYYAAGFLDSDARFSWSRLGTDVLYGGAQYHLYFLLVTMQLYLVFPLLVRFVRATSGHAWAVLGVVGAVNLAWLGVLEYVPDPRGDFTWVWAHAYELLPTYSVYVLAGCYAATHLDQVAAAVRDHRRRLLGLAASCAALALAVYAYQLGSMAPRTANAVLQPAMAATCVAAAIALYVLGSHWAAGPRRWARAVVVGSEISFGVYLAHPLVLDLLLHHGLGNGRQVVPAWVATVLGILGAATGAAILALVARRTPLALLLTGRARVRGRAPHTVGSAPPSPQPSSSVPSSSLPSSRSQGLTTTLSSIWSTK